MALETLLTIFSNKFFRVPDYQRGYSWGETQLEDFWGDLQNLKRGQHHYTGLLTVESIQEDKVRCQDMWQDDLWMFEMGFSAFYIIDGQQRLTTALILLKVIFDRFNDEESINFTEKPALVRKFLYQRNDPYMSYIFGYEKDNFSDQYFRINILGQDVHQAGVPERTLYTANLEFAKRFFEEKTRNFLKPINLEDLYKKVVTGLKFNFYEIDSDLDVFVSFEVMNNRGKSLSTLELLKNRLIYLSTILQNDENHKAQLRKKINEAWKTVYEYLGKNERNLLDDDDFLKDHWIMYFGYDRGEAGACTNYLLKKHFIPKNIFVDSESEHHISIDKIDDYVSSLAKSVKIWFYIFNPSQSDSTFCNQSTEWLVKLNRIGFKAFVPLIMAVRIKIQDNNGLIELLRLCERFVFLVFIVSQRQANTQNNHFYGQAKKFYHTPQDNIDTALIDILSNIKDLTDGPNGWYDLSKFVTYMRDQFEREKGFYSWNGLRYFLYEYELDLQNRANGGGTRIPSWEKIARQSNSDTIEHIYPQTPGQGWEDDFPQNQDTKYILHSLGNLCLISRSRNSTFQNRCFSDKKNWQDGNGNYIGYSNGSYSEIEVSRFENWTPEEILKRGIKLLEFMDERWKMRISNNYTNKETMLCWRNNAG